MIYLPFSRADSSTSHQPTTASSVARASMEDFYSRQPNHSVRILFAGEKSVSRKTQKTSARNDTQK